MKESLLEAKDELKRVDHQIYVSLKYTRTVDVLMNCLGRMIDAYGKMIDCLLEHAVEKRRISEHSLPSTPLERANLAKQLYADEAVQNNLEMYFLFRKIVKTNPKKEQEFRRHVTLRTVVDTKEITVDIDKVTEYYKVMMEFFDWIRKNTSAAEE